MKETIVHAINNAILDLGIEGVDFVVEHPAELTHGDYASNVALVVSSQLGKAPRQVAEELQAALLGTIDHVESIDVAGPGFLNFHLQRDFFIEKITHINEVGEEWGKAVTHHGEVVLFEYTSPNLFKPLHVGNLVGNIIGESLSRLFEYNGAEVRRINYPSDIGLTVAKGVWGLRETGGDPADINALGEAYRFGNEAYETDEAKKAEIIAVNQALYAGNDAALNKLRDEGLSTSKQRLLGICASLGTAFDPDGTIYESDAAPRGVAIVKDNTPKVFEESEGAVIYRGEKVGLHTRVFLNSKELPTYEAKDLGNFVIKQERFPHWHTSIVVTGNEQAEYFKVVYAVIKELYPELEKSGKSLEHVPTGFLTLTTGKMSSRKGNILSGEQVLEELEAEAKKRSSVEEGEHEEGRSLASKVATAAIKYQILRHSIGSSIIFDKQKALSFEGDSGPYLQYTHARICSVLTKAATAGVAPTADAAPANPYDLERLIYQFPEVIEVALRERAPHKVVTFLTELASEYNTFYAQEKIADSSDGNAPYKVALTQAVGKTLKNGLLVLGIEAPEKM